MSRDIYAEVTDRLVASLEAALATGTSWVRPWATQGTSTGRPKNATSGHVYKGINTLLLWAAADTAGFSDGRWASFKQWQAVGASVRKGEKGTLIVFFKPLEVEDANVEGGRKVIPMIRSSYVFNIAQVDNCPERIAKAGLVEVSDLTERLAKADAMVAATGAVINHGGDRAFYAPARDCIQMPTREAFAAHGDTQSATEAYYSTLLHELVHWTGHKTRLDRFSGSAGFGSPEYASEELVAEIGAAFLCSIAGVSAEPRADHGAYLAAWLAVLKNDKRAIFKAASLAEKATDLIAGPVMVGAVEEEALEAA